MRGSKWKNGCAALSLIVALLLGGVVRAAEDAKPADKKVALNPAQQNAADKLGAKGALVIPLAANSDALVVSLANAGKAGGDAEMELVKQLPKVEQLDLRGTGVTDKGLASLEGMNDLVMLHLENTAVTDAGMAHLKGLANLQYLNLFNTAVTDKGAAELSGLKNLKKLYLWQTKVTDAGAADLKKAIPSLYVNRGEELAIATQPAAPIAVAAPAPAPAPVAPPKPAVVAPAPAPAPKPAVVAAPPSKVDVAIEATVAAAKAAIDAKATEAKAEIDAKASEAKAAIDKVAALRVTTAAAPAPVAQVASTKIINTKCPLSGEKIDPAQTVVFEGKTVALCCDKCKAKFEADPKKFADKIVADAK